MCFGFQRGASMDPIGSRTSHRCSIGLGSEDFGVQVNGSNSHIPRAICEQVLVDRGVPLPRWVKGPLVPRQNSPLKQDDSSYSPHLQLWFNVGAVWLKQKRGDFSSVGFRNVTTSIPHCKQTPKG